MGGGSGGSFTPADGGPSRVEWVRWVDSQPRTTGTIDDGGANLYPAIPRAIDLDRSGALHLIVQGGINTAYWPTADGGFSIVNETSMVKLSSSGDWLGIHKLITGADHMRAIAPTADGGLYVAGSFQNQPQLHNVNDMNSVLLTQPGGFMTNSHQGLFARYTAGVTPAREWQSTFGSIAWDEARDLVLNPVGGGTHEYVVTGYFSGSSVAIGRTTTVTMTGNCGGGLSCAYLAAFDGTGAAVWANWAERASMDLTSPSSEAFRVVADDAGNYYLIGAVTNGTSVRFFQNPATPTAARAPGTDVIVSASPSCGFIAKYNNQGVLQWVKRIGERATNVAGATLSDVAVNPATGQLFVVGHLGYAQHRFDPDDPMNLFPADLNYSSLYSRGFLASYSTTGQFLWVQQGGVALGTNPGVEYVKAVATDRMGHVYAAGWLEGSTRFGAFAVTPTLTSFFVASYDLNGVARWVEATSDKAGAFVAAGYVNGWTDHHLRATDDGSAVYAAGIFNGSNLRIGAAVGPWRLTNEATFIVKLRAQVP